MKREYIVPIDFIGDIPPDNKEIVRCKDCKHGSLYCTEDVSGETLIECNRPGLGDVIDIHGWKWFCADGERRNNNARVPLKEQEPKTVQSIRTFGQRMCGYCPSCGRGLDSYQDRISGEHITHFCYNCGQAVKWE